MMTKKEIRICLEKVEKDSRINMKSADTTTNAPLALAQMGLEMTSDVLRKILGLPGCNQQPVDWPVGG